MDEHKFDEWRGYVWTGVPYLLGFVAGVVGIWWISMLIGFVAGWLIGSTNTLVRDLFAIKRERERHVEMMQQEQIRSVISARKVNPWATP